MSSNRRIFHSETPIMNRFDRNKSTINTTNHAYDAERRAYYQAHKDYFRKYNDRYCLDHKEKLLLRQRERNARKKRQIPDKTNDTNLYSKSKPLLLRQSAATPKTRKARPENDSGAGCPTEYKAQNPLKPRAFGKKQKQIFLLKSVVFSGKEIIYG